MRGALLSRLGAVALLAICAAVIPAAAQTAPNGSLPITQIVDQNGNLVSFASGGSASHSSYTLLAGGTPAASTPIQADSYSLSLPSAFNGATISVTFTAANGTTQSYSYTSQPASPPIFTVYAGTSVTATASGGTPTGNTVLAGGPASGGAAALSASEAHIGEVSTHGFSYCAPAFTRPANATPYPNNGLVANSTTAASVVPISLPIARINGGSGRITTVTLWKSGTSITNAQFGIKFYSSVPTYTNGDGGAWLTTGYGSGIPIFARSASVTVNMVFSDGAAGEGYATYGPSVPFKAASGSNTIYANVVTASTYTPISAETFVLCVSGDTD